MKYFEHLILESIRACDRKILETAQKNGEHSKAFENLNDLINTLITNLSFMSDQEKILMTEKILNTALTSELNPLDLMIAKKSMEGIYYSLTGIPSPDNIKSDDELRNINSFEFLRNLSSYIPESLRDKDDFREVYEFCSPKSFYSPGEPYGNYYSNFLLSLQRYIFTQETKFNRSSKKEDREEAKIKLDELDELVNAIYINPNFALERSYSMVRDAIQNIRQTDEVSIKETVKKRLSAGDGPIARNAGANITSPTKTESKVNRLTSNIGSEFKPMTTTSQPSAVNLRYKTANDPLQLRFGTQGEIEDYNAKINVIFDRWIKSSEEKYANENRFSPFTHIYFNNLSRLGGEDKYLDLKRQTREKDITIKLEDLESNHSNIAVITIPSDDGLMNHHLASKRKFPAQENGHELFMQILAIANGTSNDIYAKDFHISKNVKNYLYGDGATYSRNDEDRKISELLKNTYLTLGYTQNSRLSEADQQAIYFHFMKFELSNFILEKLDPKTFNFACKDAIDRGGVSSAYYNLLKSIHSGNPITQDEFERILHGAPTLVKGRGMNKHTHLIWNTVDAYLEQNKQNPMIPEWLPKWRDKHAIPASPQYDINELKNYIEIRRKEGPGFFGNSIVTKLNAARKLLSFMETHLQGARKTGAKAEYAVDEKELSALSGDRLGTIVSNMSAKGFLEVGKKKHEKKLGG